MPTWFTTPEQAINLERVIELRVIQQAGKWHVAAFLEATPGRPQILLGSGFPTKSKAQEKLLAVTQRHEPHENEE